MPNIGKIKLNFKDVYGNPVKDSVRLTFDNFHVKSLNFRITVNDFPYTFELPGFPNGMWTVYVQPEHYRSKTIFCSVPSNKTVNAEQVFFLDANHARAILPSTDTVFSENSWAGLASLLKNSIIDEIQGRELYDELKKKANHLTLAGLLNLHWRTKYVVLNSGNTVFSHLVRLEQIKQDRIFAFVNEKLHDDVIKSVKKSTFNPANGSLHKFPTGFEMFKKNASFKTPEKAGNLQLTFAADKKGKTIVDADIDEANGIKHAFEVLGHVFTGGRTNPYDVHQILNYFYDGVDLGYKIVPG
jgi:hypothetical protein